MIAATACAVVGAIGDDRRMSIRPVLIAVVVAAAAPAAADVRPTGGIAVGVLSQPSDDDSFSGLLVTGHGGVALDAVWSVVLRVGRSHDSYVDPFDPITYDDTVGYVVPSVRAHAGPLWVETGLGWRGRWRTVTGHASTTDHRLAWWLGLGLQIGPRDHAGLELGVGLVSSAGLLATAGVHY